MVQTLRRARLPVILVGNKVDNSAEHYAATEFYRLGLGDSQCISAVTGGGTSDLLDLVLEKLSADDKEALGEGIPRSAVVGRSNADKNSFINALIGGGHHIMTEITGTTHDNIYTWLGKFGFDFYLVGTAGIHRKSKVSENLEPYSVMCSVRSIENSDMRILIADAT